MMRQESQKESLVSQDSREYFDRLYRLRDETLYGHGVKTGVHGFPWQKSAAILDAVRGNGVPVPVVKSRLKEETPFNWDYSMQLAEDTSLPQGLDFKGETPRIQMLLIDAVDAIPKLAREHQFQPLSALTLYGINQEREEGKLLTSIIYDYGNPEARKVRSFRLDTTGGVAITEAQIAMGGWNSTVRIPMREHHIGNNGLGARVFYGIMQEGTGKSNPSVASFVDKGVMRYWPEYCDFTLAIQEYLSGTQAYTVGNGGFEYREGRLWYANGHNGSPIPIDAVYTLADARRLLKPDCIPILRACAEGRIYLEPTLNPLLNNYHLVRALLFHANEEMAQLFEEAFSVSGSNDPSRDLEKARTMTIPMSLVEEENTLNLPEMGIDRPSKSWREALSNLRTAKGEKILSNAVRKRLIIRSLLSQDLASLSGGFGSVKMDSLPTQALIQIFEESMQGMRELRVTGRTKKRIVGVEPLVKHPPKSVKVFNIRQDGSETVEETDAVHRFCPFYHRESNGQARLLTAISFYSSTEDATYKLGGRIYAEGAHYA